MSYFSVLFLSTLKVRTNSQNMMYRLFARVRTNSHIDKIIKINQKNNRFIRFFHAIAQTLEHFTKLPKHTYTRPGAADVTSLLYSILTWIFSQPLLLFKCAWLLRKASADHYICSFKKHNFSSELTRRLQSKC